MPRYSYIFLFCINWLLLSSCEKLVEVDAPDNKIIAGTAFENDPSATSAVLGIYSGISGVSGMINSYSSIYGGLSADELKLTGTTASRVEFATNSLQSANSTILYYFWQNPYQQLYRVNACIEGITASAGISDAVKKQLLGECKWWRAYIYFYLVNYFGEVPLVTGTDYTANATLPRTPIADIEKLIATDLEEAKGLLKPAYPSSGVVRVNQWAAVAMQARFFLYQKKYAEAEAAAGAVIGSGAYQLESDLNSVFLGNNKEAIFQLLPVQTGYNTYDGNAFVPTTSASTRPDYILTPSLLNAFGVGDKRKSTWTKTKTVAGIDYTHPYKYKKRSDFTAAFALTEYLTLLRLGEQYLIRAEARAQLNNINGAVADLNIVRARARDNAVAGALPDLLNTLTQPQVLMAVEQERRVELFAESARRWFDLKRTGRADAVMIIEKPTTWQTTDQLYPIPKDQRLTNPALTQNTGYN